MQHIGCRLCVIEEHSREILLDNDDNTPKALMMCYVAGFAEHMAMAPEMQKNMCLKHGMLIARYAMRCVQMMAEMLEKAEQGTEAVLELPPIPGGKDMN